MEDRSNALLTDERSFLEGPKHRLREFLFSFRVQYHFIKAFRKMHFLGPCVTVFGSARFEENTPYYQQAVEIGRTLSEMGFTVMTGGGPGLMEAANRGAFENGGVSVGCNIILPEEQDPNPYLQKWIDIPYFFIRKFMLMKYSYAFIVMPGGMGTLDELFEALTLIQNRIIRHFPVIIFGKEYHKELYEHIQLMAEEESIAREDMEMLFLTDSVEEMKTHLIRYAIEAFGLVKKPYREHWLFGE